MRHPGFPIPSRYLRFQQFFLALFMVGGLSACPALADSFTVFGPHIYIRESGKPVAITSVFSASAPNAHYFLRVQSQRVDEDGDSDSDERDHRASAHISLNGTEILAPGDFHSRDRDDEEPLLLIDKPVQLAPSNTIKVEVHGRRGVKLSVSVIGTDGTMLPIFGPKQYSRGSEERPRVVNRFQNCEKNGQYDLVISNGNPDGTDRVRRASIKLNGHTIIDEDDFEALVSGSDDDDASKTQKVIRRPIDIEHDNQLDVRVHSDADDFFTLSIECVSQCLDVQVTTPPSGSSISLASVNVLGTVTSSADEVGTTVNSRSAFVNQDQFAVANVPLSLGTNSLVARATNVCGNQAIEEIEVNSVALNPSPILVTAVPPLGLAPLTVSFAIPTPPTGIVQYQWDFNGTGATDASGQHLTDVTTTYDQPGLFVASVTATDTSGNKLTGSIPVLVLSKSTLAALLQARWSGLKTALGSGDIETAVGLFHPGAAPQFRNVFTSLSNQLPEIASSLNGAQLSSMFGDVVELITTRTGDNGEIVYFIYMVQDENGLWKFISM